jgi:hypothetical protein
MTKRSRLSQVSLERVLICNLTYELEKVFAFSNQTIVHPYLRSLRLVSSENQRNDLGTILMISGKMKLFPLPHAYEERDDEQPTCLLHLRLVEQLAEPLSGRRALRSPA